ncbi:MAG TPA: flavodoxin domain-containing protein [Acidimicrobiales bacterium]|nr:flavodoxin domain-containing protein [Acidimicrobiales bacterium]
MKAMVIYESMYGNTHLIANAIGDGLRQTAEVVVVPVARVDRTLLDEADLIVVGGRRMLTA